MYQTWKLDELTEKSSKNLAEASRLLKSDSVTKFFATSHFSLGKIVDSLNIDLIRLFKEKTKD